MKDPCRNVGTTSLIETNLSLLCKQKASNWNRNFSSIIIYNLTHGKQETRFDTLVFFFFFCFRKRHMCQERMISSYCRKTKKRTNLVNSWPDMKFVILLSFFFDLRIHWKLQKINSLIANFESGNAFVLLLPDWNFYNLERIRKPNWFRLYKSTNSIFDRYHPIYKESLFYKITICNHANSL